MEFFRGRGEFEYSPRACAVVDRACDFPRGVSSREIKFREFYEAGRVSRPCATFALFIAPKVLFPVALSPFPPSRYRARCAGVSPFLSLGNFSSLITPETPEKRHSEAEVIGRRGSSTKAARKAAYNFLRKLALVSSFPDGPYSHTHTKLFYCVRRILVVHVIIIPLAYATYPQRCICANGSHIFID